MAQRPAHNVFDCNHACSFHGGRSDPAETSTSRPKDDVVTQHECSDPSCILCVRETWCRTCDDWVPDDQPCHHIYSGGSTVRSDVSQPGRGLPCSWPCDDDCPELCHTVHEVQAKRDHERENCPAVTPSRTDSAPHPSPVEQSAQDQP